MRAGLERNQIELFVLVPRSFIIIIMAGILYRQRIVSQGLKPAPVRQPMTGKFYVGPVVKLSITSIQIMEFGSCRAGRNKVSLHTWCLKS